MAARPTTPADLGFHVEHLGLRLRVTAFELPPPEVRRVYDGGPTLTVQRGTFATPPDDRLVPGDAVAVVLGHWRFGAVVSRVTADGTHHFEGHGAPWLESVADPDPRPDHVVG